VGDDNVVYMSKTSTGVTLGANTEHNFDPVCLSARGYTFTITDTYGDGICCTYGNGFYKYTVGEVEKEGGEFEEYEKVTLRI